MKTTKETLEEHDKHCGCNEVHSQKEQERKVGLATVDSANELPSDEILKGCEFCGTKENCNNYYLGRKDAIDEMSKKLKDKLGGEDEFSIWFKQVINEIAKEMQCH